MSDEYHDEIADRIRFHHEELKRELAEIDQQFLSREPKWPQFEQDNYGEWVARAACGHVGNPDEMSNDGKLCINCWLEGEDA